MKKLIYFGRDRNFVALSYLLFSIFIASIAVGINVIAFPAILLENNVDAFFIGLSATNEIIFGVLGAIIVSRIVKKISTVSTAFLISVIYAACLALIFFYQNFLLWIILAGLTGASWISLYVIRQAWINSLISDKNRSLILAFTTTIFCLGFIIGAFIVKHIGALNHGSLLTSSGLVILSAIFMVLIKETQPREVDSDTIKITSFVKKLPNESLARFLLDLQAGVTICLGVVFGTKIGLSVEDAGFLLAGFMASGLFDLYAGYLVKTFNRQKMIVSGFLGCSISILVGLCFYDIYAVLWSVFLFFGAFCALIMISTLTIVNESFDKNQLIAANGTFQAIGSFGSVVGCLLGGIMLEIFDYYGFFMIIILANLIYFGYLGVRKK